MRAIIFGLLFGLMFAASVVAGKYFDNHAVSALLGVLSLMIVDMAKLIWENKE